MNIFKRIFLAATAAITAIAPIGAVAAETVRLESQVTVANVTGGATPAYQKSIAAITDDVVRVQVWYHNMENEDSGLVAQNLKVKIAVPTSAGKIQTVTSTVSADNANTVVDTATINLSLDRAYLEYIPGTAKWRHNAGTNASPNYVTETIGDAVVGDGVVLENAQPCFNFGATVTAEYRVLADVVSITKKVRTLGETAWVTENTAKPGDTLEYLITFKNEGNTVLRNVAIGDNMPAKVTYVPGSTKLKNGTFPNGTSITSDNITTGGIDVGNYNPGAVGYVWFQAKIASDIAPGTYKLTNVGVVRPEGMNEHYNTAVTLVAVNAPAPTPTPTPTPTPALPETGVEGAAAGMAGSGALGYSLYAWRRSKRNLLDALLNR